MLSPAGVPIMPEDFDIMKELEKFPKNRRPPKLALNLAKKIWRKKWSPFGAMRKSGRGCVNCLLKGYVKRRFYSIPKNEIDDYKVYLHQTLLREGSTEYSVFVIFDYLMFSHKPLELDERLGGIQIPVSFFYGDRDWMPK